MISEEIIKKAIERLVKAAKPHRQTAEKMLKAVLSYQGIEIPFTYRLTDLGNKMIL